MRSLHAFNSAPSTMAGFGCGGRCSGMHGFGGDEPNTDFPTVARVLMAYIEDSIRSGQKFYISPELNSEALLPDSLGFWGEIFATVMTVAKSVGSTVVKVLPSIASTAGNLSAIRSAQGQQVVQQSLQQQGIVLPGQVQQQVTQAAVQDAGAAGGGSQQTLILMALMFMGALVLLKS